MACSRCGYPNPIKYCPICGAPYEPPLALPAPPKNRTRIPVLILMGLFVIGLALFFLIPLDSQPISAPQCFRVENGTLYFDAEYYDAGTVLTVPDSVNGAAVTALSVGCFENTENITTIILPDGLTEIRERAFAGCTDLRGVKLPQSVTSIGAGAFRNCVAMEALYIPTTVTSIGTDAFSGCSSLLYVFYSGLYQYLQELYPQAVNPYTYAICLDGIYQFGIN